MLIIFISEKLTNVNRINIKKYLRISQLNTTTRNRKASNETLVKPPPSREFKKSRINEGSLSFPISIPINSPSSSTRERKREGRGKKNKMSLRLEACKKKKKKERIPTQTASSNFPYPSESHLSSITVSVSRASKTEPSPLGFVNSVGNSENRPVLTA